MNPYKSIPFTARTILEREYETRMFMHRRLADWSSHEPRSDSFQNNNSSAEFYEKELAKVRDSLS